MQLSLQNLRDKIDAVYDVTITYGKTWDPANQCRKSPINMFGKKLT